MKIALFLKNNHEKCVHTFYNSICIFITEQWELGGISTTSFRLKDTGKYRWVISIYWIILFRMVHAIGRS